MLTLPHKGFNLAKFKINEMDNLSEKILSIDIGGSHIKATVLNTKGDFLQEYERQDTPRPSSPKRY